MPLHPLPCDVFLADSEPPVEEPTGQAPFLLSALGLLPQTRGGAGKCREMEGVPSTFKNLGWWGQ